MEFSYYLSFYFKQTIGQGSGIFGSIVAKDLSKAKVAQPITASASPSTPGEFYEDRAISNVRNVIAKRLLESKQVGRNFFPSHF